MKPQHFSDLEIDSTFDNIRDPSPSGSFDANDAPEYHLSVIRDYVKAGRYNDAYDYAKLFRSISNPAEAKNSWDEELTHEVEMRYSEHYNQANEIALRIALGFVSLNSKSYREANNHFAEIFKLKQGPLVPNVAVVGEGQIGISNSTPMGTDNILQCAVLIVRHDQTQNTLLAHVNKNVVDESLSQTLLRFVNRRNPNEFTIHLLGCSTADENTRHFSSRNLEKTERILSEQGLSERIISYDVGDHKFPRAIVYYPESGKLIHGVGIEDENFSTVQRASAIAALYQLANKKQNLVTTEMSLAFKITDGESSARSIGPQGDLERRITNYYATHRDNLEGLAKTLYNEYLDRTASRHCGSSAIDFEMHLSRCVIDLYATRKLPRQEIIRGMPSSVMSNTSGDASSKLNETTTEQSTSKV